MRASARGKIILFSVLFFIFIFFVFAKYFFLDKTNQYGELKVISSPETSLFIDNVAIGKTPFDGRYKVGEYLLKLIPEGNATDTASWQGRAKVYKNSLTYVNIELGTTDLTTAGEIFYPTKMDSAPSEAGTGEIAIDTDPNGAIVKLDNDEKGVASMVLSAVPKGTHEINVYLPGFFPRTEKINVEEGYRTNTFFKLAVDLSQKQATPSVTLNTKTTTKTNKILFTVKIKNTPTGFLRVRDDASISASEEAQVQPGQTFDVLEEKNSWYRISYQPNKEGWISAEYTEKVQ
jgi:hypothetical protein